MPRCAWRETPGFGMLLDSTYGQKALYKAAKAGLWLARPVESPARARSISSRSTWPNGR